jgi:hypothetical protein
MVGLEPVITSEAEWQLWVMCGWPPAGKGFFRMVDRWSCGHVSGLLVRPRPQALMGTVDRDLIRLTGSRCPLTQSRSLSIRR